MARTTPRKSGPERREEIARAALQIMGARGSSGLTMAALAEAVGLTSGALFRHFANRDAILEAAVELAVSEVEATFPAAELPAIERLGHLARARIALLSKEPAVAWLLRSGQAVGTLPPPAVKRLGGLVQRSRAYIRDALRGAVAAGDVRTDVSPDVLLLIFTSTVHALIGRPGSPGRTTRGVPPDRAVDELLVLLASAPTTNGRS